jgi:hypothetical protein
MAWRRACTHTQDDDPRCCPLRGTDVSLPSKSVLLVIGTLDALAVVLYTAWMARKHLQSAHWERVLQGDAEHTTIRDYSVRGFNLPFRTQRRVYLMSTLPAEL